MARGKGPTRQGQQTRVEDEEASVCPLCIEPLDAHEQDWFPCACGYQVCAFCYQRLRLENNNQCPGCRTEYGTHSTAGPRVDTKARLSPAKKAVAKHPENGIPSPARPTGPPRAPAVLEVSPRKAARPVEVPKAVPIALPSKPLPDRAIPAAAPISRPRPSAMSMEALGRPGLGAPSPSLQVAPEAKSSSEEQLSGAAAGPSRASPWGAQPAARPARPPPPPSPTKWPELGGAAAAASPPAAEGPETNSAHQSASAQQPSPTGGSKGKVVEPSAARRKGRTYPAELLWSMLLGGNPTPPDPRGNALRESIQQAVESGQLSSGAGAAKLVAHLASTARLSEPAASQQAQRATPQRDDFVARPPPSSTSGNSLEAAVAARSGGSSSHVSASDWLQSGVAAALGLPAGPGPPQPPAQADPWARSQQPQSNLWGGSRLDADVVPNSLQELWANPTSSSSNTSREQYSSLQNYGSYTRRSGDPLEAAASSRVPTPNGYPAASQYAAPAASQYAAPAASHALSQGVSAGLGLGATALHASNAYLQGVRAALEYGLPPGFSSSVGQATWNGHSLAPSIGGSQGHHAMAPALSRASPRGWPLPEMQHQGYAPQQLNGVSLHPPSQSAPLQPPPGWGGYSNGLGSRLYQQ